EELPRYRPSNETCRSSDYINRHETSTLQTEEGRVVGIAGEHREMTVPDVLGQTRHDAPSSIRVRLS
ncbi:MAG: hypothetical protein VX500_04190, partial [Planctomycetota bacterium]|nr:hypothetical protein [Planctomycetota bacterium]